MALGFGRGVAVVSVLSAPWAKARVLLSGIFQSYPFARWVPFSAPPSTARSLEQLGLGGLQLPQQQMTQKPMRRCGYADCGKLWA